MMDRRMVLKMALMAVPGVGHSNDQSKQTGRAPELEGWMPKGLREEMWEPARYPGRFHRLQPEFKRKEEGFCTYAYALYSRRNGHDIPINTLAGSGEQVFPRVSFHDLMESLAPKTLGDLKFGYSIYRMCLREWMCPEPYASKEPILNDPIGNWPQFTPVPAVDALLRETRGALLWAEQLHDLFILFGPDYPYSLVFPEHEHARRFRMDLYTSKREEKTWEHARKLLLGDGVSLADVMEERLIFGYTVYPHVHGFARLVEHITDQKAR